MPRKMKMKTEMLKLFSPFDFKNIARIVDVVSPLWSPEDLSEDFRRLYAEFIVRENICAPGFSLQLASIEGDFLSAAFANKKGAKSGATAWIKSKNLDEKMMKRIEMAREYLEMMDAKTYALMNENDIKLSLFVSAKKGAGSPLLQKFTGMISEKGFKNIFLWTDIECNYDWYFKHGYNLILRAPYAPFSEENAPYETFVFKKSLAEK